MSEHLTDVEIETLLIPRNARGKWYVFKTTITIKREQAWPLIKPGG